MNVLVERRNIGLILLGLLCGIILWILSDALLEFSLFSYQIMFLTFMTIIIICAYFYYNHGVHTVFIFLTTLFLFQGGLIIASLFPEYSLSYVLLQGANFYLPDDIIKQAIILVILSAIFVMISSVCFYRKNLTIKYSADTSKSTSFYLVVFFLTFPFLIYKNIVYLQYIWENGGYIAIYTSGGEHLQLVGNFIRGMALMAQTSFIIYFIHETNQSRLLKMVFIFFIVSFLDLFIGLRGKFFTFWLTFILFYKMKFGERFSLKFMIQFFIIIALFSVFFGLLRENRELIIENPIMMFLASQGVSFHVTALSVFYEHEFSRNAWNYIFFPLVAQFKHQNEFAEGTLLANDLSMFLNYAAFVNGYGTGSAYLAEAYLAGGVVGLVFFSILLGIIMNFISYYKTNPWLSAVSFVVGEAIFFMPRASLLSPLANTIKYLFIFLLLFLLQKLYIALRGFSFIRESEEGVK